MKSWEDIDTFSRVGSALSYLTAGWGGLILYIILYFMKKTPSRFFQFNVYQSIFISFLVFTLCWGYAILFDLFAKIPLIQILVSWFDLLLNRPILFGYSFVQMLVVIYMVYVVVLSIMGRYPIIYKISKLINRSVR